MFQSAIFAAPFPRFPPFLCPTQGKAPPLVFVIARHLCRSNPATGRRGKTFFLYCHCEEPPSENKPKCLFSSARPMSLTETKQQLQSRFRRNRYKQRGNPESFPRFPLTRLLRRARNDERGKTAMTIKGEANNETKKFCPSLIVNSLPVPTLIWQFLISPSDGIAAPLLL